MVFLFLEYDFKVVYKPRKKHVVVDVLIFKKKLLHQPKNLKKSNLKNGCQMGKCHACIHDFIHDCRLRTCHSCLLGLMYALRVNIRS
jgi:aerobic-type carbon monoxide dehydrogenase small subunit (CoxS/CutS family)